MVPERLGRLAREPAGDLAATCRPPWIAGWATWGSGAAVAAGPAGGDVTDREHLGMARHRQVVADDDRPALRSARRRAARPVGWPRTPAAQTIGARRDPVPSTSARLWPSTRSRRRRAGPRRLGASSVAPRPLAALLAERAEQPGRAPRRARLDAADVEVEGSPWPAPCRTAPSVAPAISTPVGPPPQTTTFSPPSTISAGSAAACSNRSRMLVRRADRVVERLQGDRVPRRRRRRTRC